MYRNLIDTKAGRLAARESALNAARERGAVVTHHPEADCISVVQHVEANYHTLTVYDGTAYRPTINEWFRDAERMQSRLDRHLRSRAARIARKAEARKQGKPMSGQAKTAAAIRRRLAQVFPGVKFSVTSESFAGGDSVSISWRDGPVSGLVDAIANQYQHGHFDGMEDIYHFRAIDPALDCPGVKYVTTRREMSAARRLEVEQAAMEAHRGELPMNLWGREFSPAKYEADHQELWTEACRAEYAQQQDTREAAQNARETEELESLRQEEKRLESVKVREALMHQTAKLTALLYACEGLSSEERAALENSEREAFGQLHGEIIKDEAARLAARYVAVLHADYLQITLSPIDRAAFLAHAPAMLERFEQSPGMLRRDLLSIADPTPDALAALLCASMPTQCNQIVRESNIVDLAAYRAARMQ